MNRNVVTGYSPNNGCCTIDTDLYYYSAGPACESGENAIVGDKFYVFTVDGLCKAKIREIITNELGTQYKMTVRLPKGYRTGKGKKWYKEDYYYAAHEIYDTVEDAIEAIKKRFKL